MITLSQSLAVILPLFDNEGNEISTRSIDRVLTLFSLRFGGATVYNVRGAWYSDIEKKVMIDENVLIESNTDNVSDDDITFLQDIAKNARVEFRQEAISIKVNGTLMIIE